MSPLATRIVRALLALWALAIGLLVLASGFLGPINLGQAGTRYYRIEFHPPAFWWAWALVAFGMAGVLAAPLFRRKSPPDAA